MLGLVAGTASFAQESYAQTVDSSDPLVYMSATNHQKVRLIVQPEASKGEIVLLDEMGHALYTETVALNEGIIQQFDIAQLASGTYRMKVSTPTGTITKTFVIQPVSQERQVVLES